MSVFEPARYTRLSNLVPLPVPPEDEPEAVALTQIFTLMQEREGLIGKLRRIQKENPLAIGDADRFLKRAVQIFAPTVAVNFFPKPTLTIIFLIAAKVYVDQHHIHRHYTDTFNYDVFVIVTKLMKNHFGSHVNVTTDDMMGKFKNAGFLYLGLVVFSMLFAYEDLAKPEIITKVEIFICLFVLWLLSLLMKPIMIANAVVKWLPLVTATMIFIPNKYYRAFAVILLCGIFGHFYWLLKKANKENMTRNEEEVARTSRQIEQLALSIVSIAPNMMDTSD